ncbi:twin-arginine translocase TatA/TatE family subunit [Nocardioides sp.]|uniref:twin-arginine translocase TatA/TatE family subunit n=1 Tax=Nocardioides sp. TaxID=35761 RepID=UPI0039E2C0AC
MLQNLTGWHALVILTIVLLIFGSAKLPALAKSVGQSMRILKDEVAEGGADRQAVQPAPQPTVTTAAESVTSLSAERRSS